MVLSQQDVLFFIIAMAFAWQTAANSQQGRQLLRNPVFLFKKMVPQMEASDPFQKNGTINGGFWLALLFLYQAYATLLRTPFSIDRALTWWWLYYCTTVVVVLEGPLEKQDSILLVILLYLFKQILSSTVLWWSCWTMIKSQIVFCQSSLHLHRPLSACLSFSKMWIKPQFVQENHRWTAWTCWRRLCTYVHPKGEGQIRHFLKFWCTNSDIHDALAIDLAWCQCQEGTGTPILENRTQQLPHLKAQWIPCCDSS